MPTPEQSVIGLIKELRAMGVRYKQLRSDRDAAEDWRDLQSVNHDIDQLLDEAIETLIGEPEPEPEPPTIDDIGQSFVKLLYKQEVLMQNAGQLMFHYKGSGFMTADDLRAAVSEMDRVNQSQQTNEGTNDHSTH